MADVAELMQGEMDAEVDAIVCDLPYGLKVADGTHYYTTALLFHYTAALPHCCTAALRH